MILMGAFIFVDLSFIIDMIMTNIMRIMTTDDVIELISGAKVDMCRAVYPKKKCTKMQVTLHSEGGIYLSLSSDDPIT